MFICFCSPPSLLLNNIMSSAYASELILKSMYFMPLSHLSISVNYGLMKHEKRDGLKLSPCFTPYFVPNQSVSIPFRHMLLVVSLYKACMVTSSLPLIPILFNLTSKRYLSTRSKAFLTST